MDLTDLVDLMDLVDVMDLPSSGFWTICVYQAVPENTTADAKGRRVLKLVGHHRSKPCDKEAARVWPEGIGFSGISLSTKNEIIVPDLRHSLASNVFSLPDELRHNDDESDFGSAVSVPIFVGSDPDLNPWGVVVATSDQANHFLGESEDGVRRTEAVRALASIVALLVAIERSTVGPSENKSPGASLAAQSGTKNELRA